MRTTFPDLPRPRAAGDWALALLLAVLCLLLALGFAPANASNRDSDTKRSETPDFDWSKKLRPGQVLEIHGVNGAIEARGVSGSQAHVSAVKTSKRCDPDEVRIEVNETDRGIAICAIYPNQHGHANTTCGVSRREDADDDDSGDDKGDDDWDHRGCDVNVHFTVEVPDGVELEAQTVNGGVTVDQVDGRVDARTVNGSLTVATDDVATARTVNGSIDVRIGQPRWDGELEFQTVNGSIVLHAPKKISGRLEAQTMNGRIETDFPITTTSSFSRQRQHITGTIGDGGHGRMKLQTLNGSIRLLEGS